MSCTRKYRKIIVLQRTYLKVEFLCCVAFQFWLLSTWEQKGAVCINSSMRVFRLKNHFKYQKGRWSLAFLSMPFLFYTAKVFTWWRFPWRVQDAGTFSLDTKSFGIEKKLPSFLYALSQQRVLHWDRELTGRKKSCHPKLPKLEN